MNTISMLLEITTNFDLGKLDMWLVNQIWLINSSQNLKWKAQDNAPYLSGKLRQWIAVEPGNITKSTDTVKIWPRKIVYAVRREFENFKNPHKKFYMKRAYWTAPEVVKEEFTNAIKIVVSKIKVSINNNYITYL